MLSAIGFESFDDLVKSTVPGDILTKKELNLEPPRSESEALAKIREYAVKNKVMTSYIGAGYYDTKVPGVILRNMLENPGWYTAYTPYQAEIAQGRLEMLLNFQTLVVDLTGLPMAVASLLDESTAAAEASTRITSAAAAEEASTTITTTRSNGRRSSTRSCSSMPIISSTTTVVLGGTSTILFLLLGRIVH